MGILRLFYFSKLIIIQSALIFAERGLNTKAVTKSL